MSSGDDPKDPLEPDDEPGEAIDWCTAQNMLGDLTVFAQEVCVPGRPCGPLAGLTPMVTALQVTLEQAFAIVSWLHQAVHPDHARAMLHPENTGETVD